MSQTNRPLKLFVHALDEQGELLGQWDGLSVESTAWQPGDLFVQHHQFAVPSGEAPAQLLIGLYDGQTLDRIGEPLSLPVP